MGPSQSYLITCASCSHEFRVPGKYLGKRVRCPHCGAGVEVAAPKKTKEDPLVGETIGGCVLGRRLGAGGLGVVYEATQESLGRSVALKLLSSKAAENEIQVKRFRREAKVAASIQHPHVVGVYDHGSDRGLHYLVMEYVEGGTLSGLIEEKGRLSWQEAADVIIQVARALELLARDGIVHRDVKPANILMTADGVAKLADLGLAKHEEPGADGTLLTMRGTMMGSPAYMAPEQGRDAAVVGHAADVYALGATFYHAVTGKPPFAGRNAMEVVRKVLTEEPPSPRELVPDLPEGVESVILDFMQKDPENRPQNPAELIAELTEVVAHPTAPVVRRRGRRRPSKKKGGGNAILVVLGLVVLAVAAGAIAFVLAKGSGG